MSMLLVPSPRPATFVMLTRIESDPSAGSPHLERLEHDVMEQVNAQCPSVRWIASYALSGPFDYLDLFEARGLDDAMRVASLVCARGHASAQVFPAMAWAHFRALVHDVPEAMAPMEMSGMGE